MSSVDLLSHQALIETIRSARSQRKVIEVIDEMVRPLCTGSLESYLGFVWSVRAELSVIDPIEVADPEEWNLIQFSRIYLHRLTERKPLAK
jgi:hypothetical protein